MAADNQVIIEIVLDDGTVQRGFAKIQNEGDKAAKSLTDGFKDALKNISNPTDVLAAFVLIKQAASLTGDAIKKAFDLVQLGEEVRAVEQQFRFLGERAGVSTTALAEQISAASGGLADTTDLLKVANEAFVTFGQSSSRLPEIITLARQVGAVFGGELTQNVERLNQAIVSGSQKQLKQLGLAVDTEKVYKEFAKTIGITVDQLTQAEKQTAILNATLEKSKTAYAGVNLELRSTTDSFTRLQNAGKDALEAIAAVSSETLGPAFTRIFDRTSEVFEIFTNAINQKFGRGATQLQADIKATEEEIKRLDSTLNGKFAAITIANFDELAKRSDQLKNRLIFLRQTAQELADQQEIAAAKTVPTGNDELKRAKAIADLRLQAENDFFIKLSAIREQGLQQELASLDNGQKTREQLLAQQLDILNNIKIQKEQQYINQSQIIDANFQSGKIASLQEAQNQEKLLKEKHSLDIAKIEDQKNKLVLDSEKKAFQERLSGTRTALGQIATLQQTSTGELAEIGKAAAITQATIDGYAAVVSAFKTVPFPFNFAAAALVGTAVAANIAKMASIGPGGGGGVSFAPVAGTAENPTVVEPVSPVAETGTREAGTSVVLNIQGDILDGDESALRITKLLNEAFDKQGVQIRRGAFA